MIKKLPIALQLYSVRDDLEADFKGTLEKVKAMGYEGVEFHDLFGLDPLVVKGWLEELGLKPVSAHIPLDDMIADPDATIGAYKKIGCKYVAMPWLAEERRPGFPKYDETIAAIEKLAAYCVKNDMQLLYHNHDFEFVKIGDEYAIDIMYSNIPELGTELDTCWVKVAGESPAKYIRKYNDRSPVVHLKDFYMPGKKPATMYKLIGTTVEEIEDDAIFEFRPVGYGQQVWDVILEAVAESNAEWVVVEQDDPSMGKTPLECAKYSIDYVKSLYTF